jgi:hypothetical protein
MQCDNCAAPTRRRSSSRRWRTTRCACLPPLRAVRGRAGVETGAGPANAPLADFLAQIGKSMGDRRGGRRRRGAALVRDDSCSSSRPVGWGAPPATPLRQHLRGLLRAARRHAARRQGIRHAGPGRGGPHGAHRRACAAACSGRWRRGLRERRLLRDQIRRLEPAPRGQVSVDERRHTGFPTRGWSGSTADGRTPTSCSPRASAWRATSGLPLRLRAGEADRDAVLRADAAAAEQSSSLRGDRHLPMSRLREPPSRRLLLERHLVSRELIGEEGASPRPRALLLAPRTSLGVMVNEEDHLRLQSLVSGFRLREAWRKVDRWTRSWAGAPLRLPPEFGYLTSCPTNVGTGCAPRC